MYRFIVPALSMLALAAACGRAPVPTVTPTPPPLEVMEQQTGNYALKMGRMGNPQYINVHTLAPTEQDPSGTVVLVLGKLACPDDGRVCVSNLEIDMTPDQAVRIREALAKVEVFP